MSLEIIGAGFGRTGTLSLKNALDQLGFPCYHMSAVTPAHVPLWRAAWRGEHPWETLFEGYRAAVDWPTAAFWPTLIEVFPQAKVILTERDAASWYRSISRTIFARLSDSARAMDPEQRERFAMSREIIAEGTFGGDLENESLALAKFAENSARCRAAVAPERLIVFEASQGWEGLCGALGVPIPDQAYPNVNSTADFRAKWRMTE